MTPVPAPAATHEFEYVFPSHPHTGLYSCVHACGRGWHVELASAAPQYSPSTYAQYSSAAHVSPSHPPQPFTAQARWVHAQSCPSLPHVQVLQPSSEGRVSPGTQAVVPSHSARVEKDSQPSGATQGLPYSQHAPVSGERA